MTILLSSMASFWYQGIDALLRGDEALAQEIWTATMLDCQVEQVDIQTTELLKLLEKTTIELLQAGNYSAAKKCYKMALEVDETFDNSTLKKILYWQELYMQNCINKGYQFSTDWFSYNILIWNQVLKRFVGSPNLSFLEVGSWEGRSTCWLLDNVLLDESSTITCIDTFQGSIEHESMGLEEQIKPLEVIFDHNIEQTNRKK